MKQAVKVDVGEKHGYKLKTKVKNKDFVSIVYEYVVDDDSVTFLTKTYLDNEASVRISFASETIYRLQMFPFHRMELRQNPVFEFSCFKDFRVHEDELFIFICTSDWNWLFANVRGRFL